jgi:hypothetical protein
MSDIFNRPIPQQRKRTEPLWKGPEADGVTFSLLSRFLTCRERFRLHVVEGLRPAPDFNHRIEYGNMWHLCEEALAAERSHFGEVVGTTLWGDNLLKYARDLARRYPTQAEQVDHWYRVCKAQFPLYVEYWSRHPDVVNRTPLLQEQVFDVPYRLPSGRTVRLRGKWDGVDQIGKGRDAGVYLAEHKTKGDVHPEQMRRQLTFDLQTLLYTIALQRYCDDFKLLDSRDVPIPSRKVMGVRYNVVRRPLSGGVGSIVRRKPTQGVKCPKCKGNGWPKDTPSPCPKCGGLGRVGAKPGETKDEFYQRVAETIKEQPDHFFMRWKVELSPADVQRFRARCLDPILEQLCDWWEYVSIEPATIWERQPDENYGSPHWQHPYGVRNVLDEGGSADLDEYLAGNGDAGLVRVDELFPELQGGA